MEELKAQKEAAVMRYKEAFIDGLFHKIIIEVSDYELKYGTSKDMPLPVLSKLAEARMEFGKLKRSVRVK